MTGDIKTIEEIGGVTLQTIGEIGQGTLSPGQSKQEEKQDRGIQTIGQIGQVTGQFCQEKTVDNSASRRRIEQKTLLPRGEDRTFRLTRRTRGLPAKRRDGIYCMYTIYLKFLNLALA